MGEQLHKKFIDDQVKALLDKYVSKQIALDYILQILGIKRRRFYELLNDYKANPEGFSIQYHRRNSRRIKRSLERIIIKELGKEKKLIDNENIPVTFYNYSFVRDQIFK